MQYFAICNRSVHHGLSGLSTQHARYLVEEDCKEESEDVKMVFLVQMDAEELLMNSEYVIWR